jgi:hypothetical protein
VGSAKGLLTERVDIALLSDLRALVVLGVDVTYQNGKIGDVMKGCNRRQGTHFLRRRNEMSNIKGEETEGKERLTKREANRIAVRKVESLTRTAT